MQKLNSLYFKASGLLTKGIDTMSMFRWSMLQKWVYDVIKMVSIQQNALCNRLIKLWSFCGSHDNLDVQFRSYQEQLHNKSHFNSGTAGTIYIIADLHVVQPGAQVYYTKWSQTVHNPIDTKFIQVLEVQTVLQLCQQSIHFILKFLLNTPAFAGYKHKKDSLLLRPPSIWQLPISDWRRAHATVVHARYSTH